MRSDLQQAALIDDYLLNRLDDPARAAFEAQMMLDTDLALLVSAQKKAHVLVERFHQRQVQFHSIFYKLMQEPAFAAHIKTLFS